MQVIKRIFGSGGESPPDLTESILNRHLDGDFLAFPMAEEGTDTAEVDKIGARFGVIYPTEYVTHICGRFPGLYVEVKEAIWPRPKLLDVGPFWSFLYAVHSFTPSPDSEPWMRLDTAAEEFQRQTGLNAAPILKVQGDANLYCATPTGDLVRYSHETNALEPISMNFWQLLEQEISELLQRKLRKQTEP